MILTSFQALKSIGRLRDLCKDIPQDLEADIEVLKKMHGHMNLTLLSPPMDHRNEEGAAVFNETLGGFYSFDIYVWEQLQGRSKYYVGE